MSLDLKRGDKITLVATVLNPMVLPGYLSATTKLGHIVHVPYGEIAVPSGMSDSALGFSIVSDSGLQPGTAKLVTPTETVTIINIADYEDGSWHWFVTGMGPEPWCWDKTGGGWYQGRFDDNLTTDEMQALGRSYLSPAKPPVSP